MWPEFSLGTWVLCEGSAAVADTGAVSRGHVNVVRLATDQVTQRAVGAGAVAGEVLSPAVGFHIVARCIRTGGPGQSGHASTTDQLAGHIRGRTWLWRENHMNPQPLSM